LSAVVAIANAAFALEIGSTGFACVKLPRYGFGDIVGGENRQEFRGITVINNMLSSLRQKLM
jgi:hypothetical protein